MPRTITPTKLGPKKQSQNSSMDDKFDLRSSLLKLCLEEIIPLGNHAFWRDFWSASIENADICNNKDLSSIRDQNLANYLTLLRACAENIVKEIRNGISNSRELLNCTRLLCGLLPCMYEFPHYVEKLEDDLFWKSDYNSLRFASYVPGTPLAPLSALSLTPLSSLSVSVPKKDEHGILGCQLMEALINALFIDKFTVDRTLNKDLESEVLWELGLEGSHQNTKINYMYIGNRIDILRLILTLLSTPMYKTVTQVTTSGSRFLTFLVCGLRKNSLRNLVLSLFNYMVNHGIVSKHPRLSILNDSLVELLAASLLLAAQLLALVTAYRVPSISNSTVLVNFRTQHCHNLARKFFFEILGGDLKFVISNLVEIIHTPLKPTKTDSDEATYPSAPSSLVLSSTVVLLEMYQCNSQSQSLIVPHLPKLVISLLYHVFAFHDVPQHAHSVKLAAYFLLSISGQENLVKESIVTVTEDILLLLPPEFNIRLPISLRDFVLVHTSQLLVAITPQTGGRFSRILQNLREFLLLTLIEMLYNFIPPVNDKVSATSDPTLKFLNTNTDGGISYLASQSLITVIALFSSRDFLRKARLNGEALALLLRAICTACTKFPEASCCLILSILEKESIFFGLSETFSGLGEDFFCQETSELKKSSDDSDKSFPPNLQCVSDIGSHEMDPKCDLPSLISPTCPTGSPQFSVDNNSMFGGLSDKSGSSTDETVVIQALRPNSPSGMSSKAREKLPLNAPIKTTWGGNEALQIICEVVIPFVKKKLDRCWTNRAKHRLEKYLIAKQIEHCDLADNIRANKLSIPYDFWPETKVDSLKLTWHDVSLGWYMSMIYWDIFSCCDLVGSSVKQGNSLMNNISTSITYLSRFASSWVTNPAQPTNAGDTFVIEYVTRSLPRHNPWSTTQTKLFEAYAGADTFSPFGLKFTDNLPVSVNNLVRRLSGLRSHSRASVTSVGSGLDEIPESATLKKRFSVSSIHSFNSLNRARSRHSNE